MKILFASSEAEPFAKTGGLADVAGALPKAIKDLGFDVRLIIPKYKMIDDKGFKSQKIVENIKIKIGKEEEIADIYEAVMPESDVKVYLVGNDKFFGRDELYQVKGKDYPDNAERYIFFCQAVLLFLKKFGWQPMVINCNDWQTGLIPTYIKTIYKDDDFLGNIATVYSIHNLGYLGMFDKSIMDITGLPWSEFNKDKLEFWDNVSFMKAGIAYADLISTVSETYAKEIQTKDYGHGLDGFLQQRKGDVYGLLNGIDYHVWDPEHDPRIKAHYNSENLKGKKEDKKILQKENKLPKKADIPLLGIISRLDDQKGFDLIAQIIEDIMALGCQFVLLGTGKPEYHKLFEKMKEKYPKQMGVNLGFDAALAQRIYAGADMFLMPSRYEPCGLGQLISFRYGAIPIVRNTGGLADTVKEFDTQTGKGNGFLFNDYDSKQFLNAIKKAVGVYQDKTVWDFLVKKVMKLDFSWEKSARKYIALYKKAVEKHQPPFGSTQEPHALACGSDANTTPHS